MFVTVCYFIAADIFLLEPKDGGRGWEGKDLGPLLLFNPLRKTGGRGMGGEGAWTSFTVYFPLRGTIDSGI